MGMPKAPSRRSWCTGSAKLHSKCAVSRQCAGAGSPRRNGASDQPSACSGTSAPMKSQIVGSTSTDSVTACTIAPAAVVRLGRGSTTMSGT